MNETTNTLLIPDETTGSAFPQTYQPKNEIRLTALQSDWRWSEPPFFVWVGFNTDLSAGFSDPFFVLVLFLLSFVLGSIGTWLGVRLNRGSSLEGFIVALGMSTKGDAELAVSLLALKAGLISSQLFSVIVIIALLSSIIPPVLFKYTIQKYLGQLSR